MKNNIMAALLKSTSAFCLLPVITEGHENLYVNRWNMIIIFRNIVGMLRVPSVGKIQSFEVMSDDIYLTRNLYFSIKFLIKLLKLQTEYVYGIFVLIKVTE
jgi:hypothetical protein